MLGDNIGHSKDEHSVLIQKERKKAITKEKDHEGGKSRRRKTQERESKKQKKRQGNRGKNEENHKICRQANINIQT